MGFFIIFNSNWGKDEPQTLRYAIMLNCSMGADAGHIYDDVLRPGSFYDFPRSPQPVINLIESESLALLNCDPDELSLDGKITLSIGIRLKAEELLITRINDPAFVASLGKNQTSKLIKKYRNSNAADDEVLKSMQKVQLMTPENIHLNSFMYEPILDLSGFHLQSLYREVKELLEA
jgi:hypothetical protein